MGFKPKTFAILDSYQLCFSSRYYKGLIDVKFVAGIKNILWPFSKALDSDSGSVLSSEALSTTQRMRNCQTNCMAKLALAEFGAEDKVSKRAL